MEPAFDLTKLPVMSLSRNITQKQVMVAIATMTLALLISFLTKLVSTRSKFRKLQAQGLPMPPHSFFFGHIPVLMKVLRSLPNDAHWIYVPTILRQQNPDLGPDYYLDLWPFSVALLIVGSPEILHQTSIEHPLEKNFVLKNFLRPLTDGLDIVSLNGGPWKKWRAIFNPGFSSAHIITIIPTIVQEVQTFCERLDARVEEQNIFALKPLTDDLILDVIGKVALDIKWQQQRRPNQVIRSLRTQIKWLTTGSENNLIDRYNPFRPLVHWYHGRIVNRYVSKELDKRFKEWQADPDSLKQNRTIIDLALKAYAESSGGSSAAVMDPYFKKICLAQLKIFLYAGHDTTSSATCYHIWLLNQHPEALARLRQEHTQVFGADPSRAAQMIIDSPQIINQLRYTTAVIKESLRLFVPVTGTRAGGVGFSVVDKEGRRFPTEGLTVWPNQQTIHHDPLYWPEAEEFIPDRWLVEEGHPLHPIKGMWRPFEQGARNCVGQELAMMEMKIVLVLLSRSYNFLPAYAELDAKTGRKHTAVMGSQAYQVESMQPRDNLPVRVGKLSWP